MTPSKPIKIDRPWVDVALSWPVVLMVAPTLLVLGILTHQFSLQALGVLAPVGMRGPSAARGG